jgi:hypothetical protein
MGTSQFKFRNSWGTTWGDGGYGYLPYQYILSKSLSSDWWVNRTIAGEKPMPPSPPPSPPPAPDGKMAYLAGLDANEKILWKWKWLGG